MGRTTGLWMYLAVTYGVSWALWLPVTFATFGLPSFADPYPTTWFEDIFLGRPTGMSHWLIIAGGVLGPAAGAIAAWHARDGSAGIRKFLSAGFDVRNAQSSTWLLWMIPLGIFALLALVAYIMFGVGSTIDRPANFLYLFLAGTIMIVGEEMGWRGTQQPLLQQRHSALWSAVLVGITWAYWHIPIFLVSFSGGSVEGLGGGVVLTALFPLSAIPTAIVLAGIFNTTRGLLIAPILYHGLFNALNADIRPVGDASAIAALSSSGIVVFLAVLWMVALVSIVVFGKDRLSRHPKVTPAP